MKLYFIFFTFCIISVISALDILPNPAFDIPILKVSPIKISELEKRAETEASSTSVSEPTKTDSKAKQTSKYTEEEIKEIYACADRYNEFAPRCLSIQQIIREMDEAKFNTMCENFNSNYCREGLKINFGTLPGCNKLATNWDMYYDIGQVLAFIERFYCARDENGEPCPLSEYHIKELTYISKNITLSTDELEKMFYESVENSCPSRKCINSFKEFATKYQSIIEEMDNIKKKYGTREEYEKEQEEEEKESKTKRQFNLSGFHNIDPAVAYANATKYLNENCMGNTSSTTKDLKISYAISSNHTNKIILLGLVFLVILLF